MDGVDSLCACLARRPTYDSAHVESGIGAILVIWKGEHFHGTYVVISAFTYTTAASQVRVALKECERTFSDHEGEEKDAHLSVACQPL